MTKEEAVKKYESNWWQDKTTAEIVDFQLYEDRLCMPFGEFHKAVEDVLKRPVFTHAFANPEALRTEYESKKRAV